MTDPGTQLQTAVTQLIEKLEREDLRPIRKKGFLCAANCCDTAANAEQLQTCVQQCEQNSRNAEEILSRDLENFQQRIQRCAADCRDRAQDKLPTDVTKQTPELINRLNQEVNSCSMKCVEINLASLKTIEQRFKSSLRNLK